MECSLLPVASIRVTVPVGSVPPACRQRHGGVVAIRSALGTSPLGAVVRQALPIMWRTRASPAASRPRRSWSSWSTIRPRHQQVAILPPATADGHARGEIRGGARLDRSGRSGAERWPSVPPNLAAGCAKCAGLYSRSDVDRHARQSCQEGRRSTRSPARAAQIELNHHRARHALVHPIEFVDYPAIFRITPSRRILAGIVRCLAQPVLV
jgi:hypothetical protein